jgi:putative Ca2+/H+ antiporter (TMEM165/GDT1 family)
VSLFETYLTLGFEHISDINGYDHILFLVALVAAYQLVQWRRLLGLITAFTLGHTLTLALSTLNIILVPSQIIEFLIPVTIFITAVYNLLPAAGSDSDKTSAKKYWTTYGLTLGFGLIHGMGFSNYLKMLLGQEQSILTPLFAFNLGLELGQLMIVAIILSVWAALHYIANLKHAWWARSVSSLAAVLSLLLMYQTKFW